MKRNWKALAAALIISLLIAAGLSLILVGAVRYIIPEHELRVQTGDRWDVPWEYSSGGNFQISLILIADGAFVTEHWIRARVRLDNIDWNIVESVRVEFPERAAPLWAIEVTGLGWYEGHQVYYRQTGKHDIKIEVRMKTGEVINSSNNEDFLLKEKIDIKSHEALYSAVALKNNMLMTGLAWLGVGIALFVPGIMGLIGWLVQREPKPSSTS